MMAWVYWGLCGLFLIAVLQELFAERSFAKQVTAALVLIPLALRLLMWK